MDNLKARLARIDAVLERGLITADEAKREKERATFESQTIQKKGADDMGREFSELFHGVKKYELTAGNDFDKAQEILDLSEHTEQFDAETVHRYRNGGADFLGTYAVQIDRRGDFSAFLNKASFVFFNMGLTPPEFEVWKSNRTESGMKFSKWMTKNKVPQDIIDFYSAQVKTEKTVFITISDRAQHIAGMSYFAKEDSWNGYGGTSCQDTRLNSAMNINLAGALHDDKLFIAMMHYNLDDLDDFEDKLKARVLMRLVHIDDKPALVATKNYGNNVTKSELEEAMKSLEQIRVYGTYLTTAAPWESVETVRESANGGYEETYEEYIYINEEGSETIDIECPLCGGSGEYETTVYIQDDEREVTCECPLCYGTGEYSQEIEWYVEEEIYTDVTADILPYYEIEGYTHNGYSIQIPVNVAKVREIEKYYQTLRELTA